MSRKKLQKNEKKVFELGFRIKNIMKHFNLNQSQFANKIEISNSYISELISGRIKKGGIKFWDGIRREFSEYENYLRGNEKLPPEPSKSGPGSTNDDEPAPKVGLVIDLYEENRQLQKEKGELLKENGDLKLFVEKIRTIFEKYPPPEQQEEKRRSQIEMKKHLKLLN